MIQKCVFVNIKQKEGRIEEGALGNTCIDLMDLKLAIHGLTEYERLDNYEDSCRDPMVNWNSERCLLKDKLENKKHTNVIRNKKSNELSCNKK